ncbi:unnamed protein product [Prorocentrum cordatum]|uniref:Uncharacterized protein n=1 Tax=Prorocentrum cordatum TaxID=2364126 RepID=A0ABN9VMS3_9DINO|nr:unnamed protein product [Polarella glacialis]
MEPMLARGRALRARLCTGRGEEELDGPGGSGALLHRVLFMSLARQPRRRAFLRQLRRCPCLSGRAEWLPAVDGARMVLDEVPASIVTAEGVADARFPRDKVLGYVLTRGAIGLACSLHEALRRIAQDTDEQHVYLLCEDDATFAPDFSAAFSALLAATEAHDPHWEVLHVGYDPRCTEVGPCGRAECAAAASDPRRRAPGQNPNGVFLAISWAVFVSTSLCGEGGIETKARETENKTKTKNTV